MSRRLKQVIKTANAGIGSELELATFQDFVLESSLQSDAVRLPRGRDLNQMGCPENPGRIEFVEIYRTRWLMSSRCPMDKERISQREASEAVYGDNTPGRWAFHDTHDPLVRYLRDRRLSIALAKVLEEADLPSGATALVTCAGVGGEGTFLADRGFAVTVSDFSHNAMKLCSERDPRLRTILLDAQNVGVRDNSFDLVLVQDGLHHLRKPTEGLTEMLRVAKQAVVLIEPHAGAVANILGHEWEKEEGAVNYVFRWTKVMLTQVAYSYSLDPGLKIFALRIWDHNVVVGRVTKTLAPPRLRPALARLTYALLRPLAPFGNMMVAVIIKPGD